MQRRLTGVSVGRKGLSQDSFSPPRDSPFLRMQFQMMDTGLVQHLAQLRDQMVGNLFIGNACRPLSLELPIWQKVQLQGLFMPG